MSAMARMTMQTNAGQMSAQVGHDKRDEGAQIPECSGPLHAIEAVAARY